jgi:hypothetical protein
MGMEYQNVQAHPEWDRLVHDGMKLQQDVVDSLLTLRLSKSTSSECSQPRYPPTEKADWENRLTTCRVPCLWQKSGSVYGQHEGLADGDTMDSIQHIKVAFTNCGHVAADVSAVNDTLKDMDGTLLGNPCRRACTGHTPIKEHVY